jgi:hypothetical protein
MLFYGAKTVPYALRSTVLGVPFFVSRNSVLEFGRADRASVNGRRFQYLRVL